MKSLIPYQGKNPRIHESVFIADGVRVIGDVEIGEDSSVWFNTVIRGDVHFVRIGKRTNIQDNCVLHVTQREYPCIVGSNVTVGHSAVVHACTIGDFCLIGMGSIILDNAKVGDYSLVAAGSLVLEHFEIPSGVLVAGAPARIKRPLSDDEKRGLEESATHYVNYARSYRQIISAEA